MWYIGRIEGANLVAIGPSQAKEAVVGESKPQHWWHRTSSQRGGAKSLQMTPKGIPEATVWQYVAIVYAIIVHICDSNCERGPQGKLDCSG